MDAIRRGLRSLSLGALLALGLGCLLAPAARSLDEEGGLPGGFAAPELPVRIEPLAEPLVAGETADIAVVYSIPDKTHLTETFFTVEFKSEPPLEFSEPVYPEGIMVGEDRIYRGEIAVVSSVRLPAEPQEIVFSASAQYQICTEGETEMCYPPGEATPSYRASLAPAGSAWTERQIAARGARTPAGSAGETAVSASESSEGTSAVTEAEGEAAGGGALNDRLQRALARGSWLAFLMVFLAGILMSFTPCVYPVIPLTIAYIGGTSQGKPLKGFVLSLWFVLGLALTYAILGLVAAATGGVFGQAMQNPWVLAFVALVVGAMGFSMAGFFDIQLPTGLTSKLGGHRSGFLAPLLMGFATGLIAAPCVGPVVVVLLTWVATTGKLLLGFWLLFTFAVGMGMLFLALGTFSGALSALPGAGAWMEGIKHFFALLLWGLALWFLRGLLPAWLLSTVFGLVLVMALGAWGAFETLSPEASHKRGLLKGLMLFLWILGAVLAIAGGLKGLAPGLLPGVGGVASLSAGAHEEPEWIWDAQEGFRQAELTGTPVMMDFWATWCAACKELDHKSYNQTAVLDLARSFTSIKMDMTKDSDENTAVMNQYGVVGMPTVIFFDSRGREIERFSGFKKGEELAAIMARVLDQHKSS